MIDFFEERKKRRKESRKRQMIGSKVSLELKTAFKARVAEEKRKNQTVWLIEAVKEKLKKPPKLEPSRKDVLDDLKEAFKGSYIGCDIPVDIVADIAKRLVEEKQDYLSVWFREAIEEKLNRPARKIEKS